ncbi:uncharacterized protein LOC141692898 [Apium graveolens]|uniref:uncharacterized protein LOC141692898 n=1 Tax=Apium graveolens TaxID=4045 RepID=UPI003D7A48EF
MVKKANGKWSMCIDFTDLNDACPKDCYPLPRIDTLIDATAGHEMLSFMDDFGGYNHIKMHKDDTPKKPVYHVSKVLHEAELNYSITEKFELAFIKTSRKVASRRLVKWVNELGKFDIKYKPRMDMKAQALADFVVEFTINDQEVGGLVLQSLDGFMIEYNLRLDFLTMNQEAEYKALIVSLGLAIAVRAKNPKVCGDSRLVVAHVNGDFEAKDDTMAKYMRVVKGILTQFDECLPIPFAIWGMDILGPFPIASGQRKFIVVAIDYFTKWIEAKALAKITTNKIAQFFWENVICRFGIPRILIIDNGRKFDNAEFRKYCDDSSIELRFTSIAHPQENGQAEVSNRIILVGLKKKVVRSRNTWADELLPILWACRTTCKVTIEATPFMLAYGAEVVVPLEITHKSPKIKAYEPEINEEGIRLALDLIDEVRYEANTRNAEHRRRVSLYYNIRVKERFFQQGDLVLRKIKVSGVGERGKLTPNLEGPYKVKKTLR